MAAGILIFFAVMSKAAWLQKNNRKMQLSTIMYPYI